MATTFSLQAIMTKEVISASPNTPLMEAGKIMARHKFNGLPIVDSENKLLGIVTEYDIISKSFLPIEQRGDMNVMTVREVMNHDPLVLEENASFDEVVAAFRDHHSVNPIPVVDAQRHVKGVVSRLDILKGL